MNCSLSPGLTWPNICPIIYDRDKLSNHEQSEINRSDDIPILSPGSTWPNICFSDFPKMLRNGCDESSYNRRYSDE